MKAVIDFPGDMILQDEVKGCTELFDEDLVSIHEAEVSGLVRVYCVNLCIRKLGEGGCFVAHKPPGKGADLI